MVHEIVRVTVQPERKNADAKERHDGAHGAPNDDGRGNERTHLLPISAEIVDQSTRDAESECLREEDRKENHGGELTTTFRTECPGTEDTRPAVEQKQAYPTEKRVEDGETGSGPRLSWPGAQGGFGGNGGGFLSDLCDPAQLRSSLAVELGELCQ